MRARRVAGLAVAAALLAGCASVPTSGPIQQGPVVVEAGNDQFIRVLPHTPVPDMTPEEIVAGFQEATAASEADYVTARSYLTPAASAGWKPGSGVQVYDSTGLTTTTKAGIVIEEGKLAARIDADWQYGVVAPARPTQWKYSLVLIDGQWRIADLPQGLVLGPGDIDRGYRSADLYFFTRDFATLVPAPITIPFSESGLATQLVNGLLAGPTTWIAPAVRTAFPEGAKLALGSVPIVDGVAEVQLTREVLSADDAARQKLSGQLVWTLRQLPEVTGVRITVNGQALTGPSVASIQPISSWATYDPNAIPSTAKGYALSPKGLVAFSPDDTTTTPVGFRTSLRSPAISLDSTRIAGLSADRRQLYVGQLVDGGTASSRYTGDDLSRPTWDGTGSGSVWVADPGKGLVHVTDDGVEVVPVSFSPKGFTDTGIVAAAMSRDATRLALLVRRGALIEPWVARVERNAGAVIVSTPVRIDGQISDALDLAWADADTLAVLGTSGASSLEVVEIGVGSPSVRHVSAPDTDITQVAAAPGRVTLVGEPTAVWRQSAPVWARMADLSSPVYPG
jgi:hypothetical protein